MAIVYALTNRLDGRMYIGCTRGKLAKRFREHRCLLRAGKHTCRPLQEAWLLHSEHVFSMECMDIVPDDLESRRNGELAVMEPCKGWLYNEEMNSFKPAEAARQKGVANAHLKPGNRWTPEANEKRSQTQKGRPISEAHRQAIIDAKRRNKEMMR